MTGTDQSYISVMREWEVDILIKRKKIISFILTLGLAIASTGCGSKSDKKSTETQTDTATTTEAASTSEPTEMATDDSTEASTEARHHYSESDIDDLIDSMTIEDKLAQMMIVALRPVDEGDDVLELNDDYKACLTKYDFGGVILFGSNIDNEEQTVRLIRDCQTAADDSDLGIPMFMCVDQEGGLVNRIEYGITSSGNMGLAATGDPTLTEESAEMLGEEIAALGFNMDFAPVSDVNNNPNNPIIGVRSFSDDPVMTAEYVCAFIRGLNKNNISVSLKHFPGHGNVGEDSHTGLPCSDLTLEELAACELIPFQAGIDEGTDMIMTAHIQYPQIEQTTYLSKEDGSEVFIPATLSRTIITDLLRTEMGYNGVVITDALDMGAISTHFDPTDAAVMAINADVDILLIPVNLYKDAKTDTLAVMDDYMKKLVARVEAGDIKMEELDNSVERILKLKYNKAILESSVLDYTFEEQMEYVNKIVGAPEHHKREWEIAQKGMTLLKNENDALPIDGNNDVKTLILASNEYRIPSVEYAIERLKTEKLVNPDNITIMSYDELEFEDEGLQKALDDADNIIILSQFSFSQKEIICKVIDHVHESDNAKVSVLSLNLPYDAACYDSADAIICAYHPYGDAHDENGNGPFNLNVAVAVCSAFGQSVPEGKVPVNIPKITADEEGTVSFMDEILYERGSGLSGWGK